MATKIQINSLPALLHLLEARAENLPELWSICSLSQARQAENNDVRRLHDTL